VVISLAPAGLFGATFNAKASCSNFPVFSGYAADPVFSPSPAYVRALRR